MTNSEKSKEQLIAELEAANVRISELEKSNAEKLMIDKKLADTQKLFESVIEQSPIPIAVADVSGQIMVFNKACTDLLGVEEPDIHEPNIKISEMNITWKDFDINGNFIPISQSPFSLALQGIKSENIERRVVRNDGTENWVLVFASPIFDDNGNVLAGFVAFPDISDHKQIEKALKISEEKYRLLADNLSDVVWIRDLNFDLIYSTPILGQ
jgi:PAS domain S-box-containing protein